MSSSSHAELLPLFVRRLAKNEKHLRRWRSNHRVEAWRLYDRDLAEIPLVVDVYGDWAHVQEFTPARADGASLEELAGAALRAVLGVERDRWVYKVRSRQRGSAQYRRIAATDRAFSVRENGLEFLVNLHDYLDTGLFLDHRDTRARLRQRADGKRFLNLFCYTATASVYAAAGRARETVSVDLSRRYLDWARSNFERNGLPPAKNALIRADVLDWLRTQPPQSFDLVFLDPPTFSNSKRMDASFDVQRDHVELLQTTLPLLAPGGELYFSNNLRRFRLDRGPLADWEVRDLTRATMPKDFEGRGDAHHLFRFRAPRSVSK